MHSAATEIINMTSIPPANPRKWLSTVKDILGETYLLKLFKVSARSLQRYTALAPYVDEESIRGNYIEKHEIILSRLISDGYRDVARSIVSRHADIVGCSIVPATAPEPDKDTIEAECLDDHPALVRFHQAILNGDDVDTVRHRAEKATNEIMETLALYRKQTGTRNSKTHNAMT